MRTTSRQDITTAALTDVGVVRKANEDSMAEFERPSGHRLLVVADGIGGHRGGATASRWCVEEIGDVFRQSTEAPAKLLFDALEAANERVYRAANEDPELQGMGTTAVIVLFTPDEGAFVAHLGDSRAYLIRDGEIRQLTGDHTVVAAMVRHGVMTEDEAAAHPRRNEILRCVGVHHEAEPEINHVETRPGDCFLLCSDGLSDQVDDDEIAAVVLREALPQAVASLVEMANARGGVDNVTTNNFHMLQPILEMTQSLL